MLWNRIYVRVGVVKHVFKQASRVRKAEASTASHAMQADRICHGAGPGWAWLGWAGLGWAGLGWARLGWATLCWAKPGLRGLGYAGLGWTSLG